jgi:hypothetical protein
VTATRADSDSRIGGGVIRESHGQLNTSLCIQQAAADRKKQKTYFDAGGDTLGLYVEC